MISLSVITSVFLFTTKFLLVLLLGIMLPGFLATRALSPKTRFTNLEITLLSFALGIGMVDASLLLLGRLQVPLQAFSLTLWYLVLMGILVAILKLRNIPFTPTTRPLLATPRQYRIASVVLILLFFIKIFYLSGSVLPTSTDLGHHLYWSKLISDTQALPVYEKQEILQAENGHYFVGAPEAISDFIVGEHLPLSFFHIFTGASYFGTFPVLFLFLLNIGSVLALATLAYYLGKSLVKTAGWRTIKPEHFFLLGLVLFGVLFSLASPEMKFVSGGVIGNLFGNLFIPLILLVLLRALTEKSPAFFACFFLLAATLAYTHHLSTFILLFVLLFIFLTLVIFWPLRFWRECQQWVLTALKPLPLATLVGIVAFAFLVALPTYLETNAVSTAVGTPTKDTRTGLTFAQVTASNSAFKLGLALAGMVMIAFSTCLRKNLGAAVLFAYGIVLLIMTLTPQLLFVDIPSNRIAHYFSFPMGLLMLFALLFLVERYASFKKKSAHSHSILVAGFLVLWLALVAPGLEDNGKTLTTNSQALFVKETFSAAQYLQAKVTPEELVVKDHNFIEASDTWMKLFFNKGYNYPFSRSFFKRYEDNPEREQCTLAMIATPNTALGKQCYEDLPVRYVVVNPRYDQAQFTKSPQFSLIYSSANIAIFRYNINSN